MGKSVKSLSRSSRNNRSSNLQAGVAGASIGTLILSLAKNIPETYAIRSWLIIASPTIAVIISWLAKKMDLYFKRKKLEILKSKLKENIDIALKNPNISVQERQDLQRLLAELEMANIESLSAKIKSINIEINED